LVLKPPVSEDTAGKEGKLSPKVLSVFGLTVAVKKAVVGMSFEKTMVGYKLWKSWKPFG
jgi:hypothetical protein